MSITLPYVGSFNMLKWDGAKMTLALEDVSSSTLLTAITLSTHDPKWLISYPATKDKETLQWVKYRSPTGDRQVRVHAHYSNNPPDVNTVGPYTKMWFQKAQTN